MKLAGAPRTTIVAVLGVIIGSCLIILALLVYAGTHHPADGKRGPQGSAGPTTTQTASATATATATATARATAAHRPGGRPGRTSTARATATRTVVAPAPQPTRTVTRPAPTRTVTRAPTSSTPTTPGLLPDLPLPSPVCNLIRLC